MKKDVLYDRDLLYDVVEVGQKVYGIRSDIYLRADNYELVDFIVTRKTSSTINVTDGKIESVVNKRGKRRPRPCEGNIYDLLFPTEEARDAYLHESIRRAERDDFIVGVIRRADEDTRELIYTLLKPLWKKPRRLKKLFTEQEEVNG